MASFWFSLYFPVSWRIGLFLGINGPIGLTGLGNGLNRRDAGKYGYRYWAVLMVRRRGCTNSWLTDAGAVEEEFSGKGRPVVMSVTGCSWVLVWRVRGGLSRCIDDVSVRVAKEV
jgi:hypothetical protein